ncbi:MAG TPA: gamma-glutamyl-gamma-aminobutyrate hydrolase family protein [Pedomonas sp.]|uniref:gamma-glutamyl-gamma-aminobutyrate hydrolase family protein n=1 Tax=Pedomonas sp. TaxID=2976421 RepID=UPI002F3F7FD4
MSDRKPLLGIVSCSRDVGGRQVHAVSHRYVEPVLNRLQATGLIVPSLTDAASIRQMAALFDGLFLPGSFTNVNPQHYDTQAQPEHGPFDESRDRTVFLLLEEMLKQGKPVFGICRGFQELNVFFGGSLRCGLGHGHETMTHHLPVHPETEFSRLFSLNHAVSIEQGGVLEQVVGRRRIGVNSVHYQGVDRLGHGLTVEALADDGLVEAISWQDGNAAVLGVQWHPEWDLATNPVSQALFDHFGKLLHGERDIARLSPILRYAGV